MARRGASRPGGNALSGNNKLIRVTITGEASSLRQLFGELGLNPNFRGGASQGPTDQIRNISRSQKRRARREASARRKSSAQNAANGSNSARDEPPINLSNYPGEVSNKPLSDEVLPAQPHASDDVQVEPVSPPAAPASSKRGRLSIMSPPTLEASRPSHRPRINAAEESNRLKTMSIKTASGLLNLAQKPL